MDLRKYRVRCAAAVCFLIYSQSLVVARAGLDGQPLPSLETTAKFRSESANILKGKIDTGRPNLFLLVQSNAASDFTPLVARVVGDDTTYVGITDTLEEAVSSTKDTASRQFIIYNLARVHLLRAKFLSTTRARRVPLTAAADAAAKFDTDLRDPAAWELKGDIDTEIGDLPASLAAYKHLTAIGTPAAEVHYKYGWAYEKANRLSNAAAEYHTAQLAQSTSGAGGPHLRHEIFQGIARVALAQGSERDAIAAFEKSARVEQDPASPFHFELGAANELLRRGYSTAVLAYAQAAVRVAPDDEEALALQERAQAAKVNGR